MNEPDLPPSESGENQAPSHPVLRAADAFFTISAGIVLFAMMAMTTVDVFGRYFFRAPLGFAFEMTQMGMALMVFLALPAVTLRAQHVTVGLFENLFAGTAKTVRDLAIAATIAVSCLYLAWRLSTLAGRFMSYGDVTSVLRFPVGYITWVGVACLVLAAIAAMAAAVVPPARSAEGAPL